MKIKNIFKKPEAVGVNPVVKQNRGPLARGVGKVVVLIAGVAFVIGNFAACNKCKDSKSDFPAEKRESGKVWELKYFDDKTCKPVYEIKPEPETCVEEKKNEATAKDSLNYWQNEKNLACAELRHVVDSLSAIDQSIANAIQGLVNTYGSIDSLPTIDAIITLCGNNTNPAIMRLASVARKAKQAWESYIAWLEKHGISAALLEECQKQNGSR